MSRDDLEQPLVVDGPRPAASWVSRLPAGWTTDAGRLILLILACDTYDDVARPGGADLARWAGMPNGKLYRELAKLLRATEERPPLVEKVDRRDQPIASDARLGRERTGYRLRTELSRVPGQITLQAGGRDDSPSRLESYSPSSLDSYTPGNSPSSLDSNSPTGLESNSPSNSPGNSPSNSPSNSPGSLETPFPSLPFPTSPESKDHLTTGDGLGIGESGSDENSPLNGDCDICQRPYRLCRRAAAATADPHMFTKAGVGYHRRSA